MVSIGATPFAAGGVCTGTLIDARWVLSAAHCITTGEPLTVGLGASMVDPLMRMPVRRWVTHPTLDVALLEIEEPQVIAALGLEPIVLARPHDIVRTELGTLVELAGFGVTESGSVGELRFVQEPLTGVEETLLEVSGHGDSGACHGDSGGPLLVQRDGLPLLAGVLSAGSSDCLGVDQYVRVDVIRPWIDRVMVETDAPASTCSAGTPSRDCIDDVALWCEGVHVKATFCSQQATCSQDPAAAWACSRCMGRERGPR